MRNSLRALLTNAIDYAGLFPPAKLPLEPAIRNYAAYRRSADAGLLGPFVIPAGQLAELAPFAAELFSDGSAFRFSVLMGGGEEERAFEARLAADVALGLAFLRGHGARVSIDAVEVRLPESLSKSAAIPTAALGAALRGAAASYPAAAWFCEIPPGPGWDEALPAVAAWLGRLREGGVRCGLKLRTGGLTADAFPSTGRIARALLACRERGIPIKFTAGLHHPIRAAQAEVQTHMHGFLNVFVAGMLAHAFAVDPLRIEELIAVLESESPRDFEFHDDRLAFRQQTVALEDVRAIRARDIISFGSCSFDEPRDDLRALGWM